MISERSGELVALGHQRAGASQRIAPDLSAVVHDRARSDEAVVGDVAAVQHHIICRSWIIHAAGYAKNPRPFLRPRYPA